MTMTDDQRQTDFSQRLREMCVGCRLSKSKWGTTKTLSKEQKERAAHVFGATGKRLSASKKLIDTSAKQYKDVTSIFSQVTSDWKDSTNPYPEDGLRLIKHDAVAAFDAKVASYQSQLDGAVARLSESYEAMLMQAREDLEELFSESDYPRSLEGLFSISVEYPSLEPDPALAEINGALYERERQRIAGRFDEALELAETAFTEELARLIEHLCGRLEGKNDGTAKVIHESNITNLESFFDRFKALSIGSNDDLERLVGEAQKAVHGIKPEWLDQSRELRDSIHSKMSTVRQQLDDMMVARPVRAISFDD